MRRRPRRRKKGSLRGVVTAGILTALLGAALFLLWEGQDKIQEKVPYQEIRLEEGTLENKYYYGQLPQEDKTAYQEILPVSYTHLTLPTNSLV